MVSMYMCILDIAGEESFSCEKSLKVCTHNSFVPFFSRSVCREMGSGKLRIIVEEGKEHHLKKRIHAAAAWH